MFVLRIERNIGQANSGSRIFRERSPATTTNLYAITDIPRERADRAIFPSKVNKLASHR